MIVFSYPSSLKDGQLEQLISRAKADHADFLQGTELIVEDNHIYLMFPENLPIEDVEAFLKDLEKKLPEYLKATPVQETKETKASSTGGSRSNSGSGSASQTTRKQSGASSSQSKAVSKSDSTSSTANTKTNNVQPTETKESQPEPEPETSDDIIESEHVPESTVPIRLAISFSEIMPYIIAAIILALYPVFFVIKFEKKNGVHPVSWIGFTLQLVFLLAFIYELIQGSRQQISFMAISLATSFIIALILAMIKASEAGATGTLLFWAACSQVLLPIYVLLVLIRLLFVSGKKNSPPRQVHFWD